MPSEPSDQSRSFDGRFFCQTQRLFVIGWPINVEFKARIINTNQFALIGSCIQKIAQRWMLRTRDLAKQLFRQNHWMTSRALKSRLRNLLEISRAEINQQAQSVGLQMRLISENDGKMSQAIVPAIRLSSALNRTEHAAAW